ncbi:MAG: rRNA methyltransferase [Treponema sp.]|nr:rRNA methyltransferase [Treponema sp.]
MTSESKQLLDSVSELINKTFPVPARFRSKLPSDIAELSKLLTSERGERSLSYLTRPNLLSAYLHYFLPWNLYRLCFLLPSLNILLKPDDIVTDIGCGPLTLTSALWISRPDLRNIPLTINCIDRSSPALEAGKKFFLNLCESTGDQKNLWKINIIKKEIDFRKVSLKNEKPAALVCVINVFNEVYEKYSHNNTEKLKFTAANAAQLLYNEALPDASILIVEPGVPQSGKFISFIRSSLLKLGRESVSPCTHKEKCPLAGNEKRWCHFVFDTSKTSKEILRLSAAAKLPKDRLVLSFIFTGKTINVTSGATRIISDIFPLPGGLFGRYGCSARGLILVTGGKNRIDKLSSFDIIPENHISISGDIDVKSRALIGILK